MAHLIDLIASIIVAILAFAAFSWLATNASSPLAGKI